MRRAISIFFLTVGLGAAPASAEPALGTWATEPDRKGQIGHVQVRRCGKEYCGRIISAYAPDGKEVVTKNVGKDVFWAMKPQGAGNYGDGRIFVPIMGRDYSGTLSVSGSKLHIRGCNGVICRAQIWKRVN